MSDWQVGDLAVCVDGRKCVPGLVNGSGLYKLQRGRVYTVVAVFPNGNLALVGFAAVKGFHPVRFRKIRPDEPEACEEEFQTLLKRSKVEA